ncbi:MFS transporter [Bradyrhizobium tropiciagri]|uniref:MFS transporter n=1 Tax=Bradyrhizobium tropiciagri TaxID=312253 RepID=UPI001BAE0EAC|nr:MFS transporter [Bradyrhizobium tropiciagri]MBR0900751.1 MFS transporter [Bradyrhizobium tropiciagri]
MPNDRPPPSQTMRVGAAILGNALEFYDFTVYAAFATWLAKAFFPAENPSTSLLLSVATFGVGFVARPLGGILIGAYADRFGRRPAMTLTIWLMAVGSGMIGLLPTYQQIGVLAPILLVFARLLQGFSAGGEMGPATTYLLESAPAHRKGFFGSWQLASQNMGSVISGLIGLLLAFTITPAATDSWGWRVPFLLGILIAPVGYYIRRNLDETMDAEEAHDSVGRVLSDVMSNHWQKIALCILLISGATISQYFFLYTATYAINTLHYSQGWSMAGSLATGLSGLVFSLVGGALADRFGVKTMAVVPRLIVTLLFYPALQLVISSGSPLVFVTTAAFLMAIHAMSSGAGIILIPMIFPSAVRTAGLSIAYALGVTIFGGTAQIVFTWIIGATGDKLSWVWYVIIMSVISVLATLAIKVPATLKGGSEDTAPATALAGVSR